MTEKELFEQLRELIKFSRKKHNITFKKLSTLVGLSEKYLNQIELGKHEPTIINFLNILKNVKVNADDLCVLITEYLSYE